MDTSVGTVWYTYVGETEDTIVGATTGIAGTTSGASSSAVAGRLDSLALVAFFDFFDFLLWPLFLDITQAIRITPAQTRSTPRPMRIQPHVGNSLGLTVVVDGAVVGGTGTESTAGPTVG